MIKKADIGIICAMAVELSKISEAMDITLKKEISGVEFLYGTLEGKNVVVIGRSTIVGLPVAKMCLDRNATVTICHSKTANLYDITRSADILIVAIGKPKFVTAEMLGEDTIVIDVGINRDENGKLCGDVDYEYVSKYAQLITPVPGGVGPMTIACLLKNTMQCYYNNRKQ